MSPGTSSSLRSRSMAAILLDHSRGEPGFQAAPVGLRHLDGATQGLRLGRAPAQVLLDLLSMPMVVFESAIDIGKLQRIELANDLFRRHPPAIISEHHGQGHPGGADADGP